MSESSQQEFSFSFGEVEAVLSQIHGIADDKRTAFQARLKNLLKLGLLPDVQAGRGRTAKYRPWHLFCLGFAIECAQLGLAPARTVDLLKNNLWWLCQVALMVGRQGRPEGGHALPMLVTFDPSGLVDMRPSEDGDSADITFSYMGLGILQESLEDWLKRGLLRLSIVNVSELVWRLSSRIAIREVERFYIELETHAKQVQDSEVVDGDT